LWATLSCVRTEPAGRGSRLGGTRAHGAHRRASPL
jgi:hypothetical protein